ncbi:MAG: phosphatidate cytidylyltransferase [Rickettsiales bacterium]|jgi:CDP-diglyceride synthetase|nr:phosphatidate cytidylyltransferase [Rickettsiales bacterium]
MNIARKLGSGVARIATSLVGGLKNKFDTRDPKNWYGRIFGTIYFTILFISCLNFKNLYLFLILGLCVHSTGVLVLALEQKRESEFAKKIINPLLLQLYLALPCASLIYLSRMGKSNDIFLWLFLTVVSVKISVYLFENIYGGGILLKKLHPTKTILGLVGSVVIGILIGLVSSLFLKQKLIHFTAINLSLVLLIHLQDILNYRIKNYYLDQREDALISMYNNLVFVVPFVSSLIMLGAIRV